MQVVSTHARKKVSRQLLQTAEELTVLTDRWPDRTGLERARAAIEEAAAILKDAAYETDPVVRT